MYGKQPPEAIAKHFKIKVVTVVRHAKKLGLTRRQKTAVVKAAVKSEITKQIWVDAEVWAQNHHDLHREAMAVLGTLKAISTLAKEKIQEYVAGPRRRDGMTLTWIDQLKSTEAMFLAVLDKLTEFERESLSEEVKQFKTMVMEALKDETPEAFEKVRIRLAGLAAIPMHNPTGDGGSGGVHCEEGSGPAQPAEPPTQQQNGDVVAG